LTENDKETKGPDYFYPKSNQMKGEDEMVEFKDDRLVVVEQPVQVD
nr:hypothetical protein [Tanacetum cinerariifolium]